MSSARLVHRMRDQTYCPQDPHLVFLISYINYLRSSAATAAPKITSVAHLEAEVKRINQLCEPIEIALKLLSAPSSSDALTTNPLILLPQRHQT